VALLPSGGIIISRRSSESGSPGGCEKRLDSRFHGNDKPCVRLIIRVDFGLPVIGAGLFNQLGLLLFNSVFASSSTNFTNPE
jgi:hypothetical protein